MTYVAHSFLLSWAYNPIPSGGNVLSEHAFHL